MGCFARKVLWVVGLCVLAQLCWSEKDIILFCDVCKGALDEIDWAMSQGLSARAAQPR